MLIKRTWYNSETAGYFKLINNKRGSDTYWAFQLIILTKR